MPKAIWNGVVLAESDQFETVEGNVYFPRSSVQADCLEQSTLTTQCPWKGEAHYYTVSANGKTNPDAAWYYPDPKPEAAKIKDHLAFWKGVEITGN